MFNLIATLRGAAGVSGAAVEKQDKPISVPHTLGAMLGKIGELVGGYELTEAGKAILSGILLTAAATAVLVLLLQGFRKVFPRVYAKLESWRDTRIRAIQFQRLVLLSADRTTHLLVIAAKTVRLVLTVTALFIYVLLAFSFFNVTRAAGAKIFSFIAVPISAAARAFVSYIPEILFICVVIVLTFYFSKLVKFAFGALNSGTISLRGFHREWAWPTYQIVRFFIIIAAAIIIFPFIPGSDSGAFKGISVFVGLVFTLGSTSAVANAVAGVVLTYMRPFKLGDRVKIADTVGDVVEKTILVTRIRTIKNVEITVPNAMVLANHIINFSAGAKSRGLILHTQVTIGYDAPWRRVHEALIAAARATPDILEQPPPFILQTALDDFYVRYELNAYTKKPNLMANIYSDLHQNIQDQCNEAGVEITSPHYSALRDGNATAVPPDYLPHDYRSPSFKIAPGEVLNKIIRRPEPEEPPSDS